MPFDVADCGNKIATKMILLNCLRVNLAVHLLIILIPNSDKHHTKSSLYAADSETNNFSEDKKKVILKIYETSIWHLLT